MSKYTGRSLNVRVESSNDSVVKDCDSFYRQIYENLRDKFDAPADARREFNNEGMNNQMIPYGMNPYYPMMQMPMMVNQFIPNRHL